MTALVLLSGGMDSTLVLYEAMARRDSVRALSIDYGQRHAFEELWRAERIARSAGVSHAVRKLALPFEAPLTTGDERLDLPTMAVVPWRNTFFVLTAAEHAAAHGCTEIWMGCCAGDAEAFPDCRAVWVDAVTHLLDVGGRQGFQVVAPLIDRTKAQIVRRAHEIGAECWHALGASWSCYSPRDARPCRSCHACTSRARGFEDAGMSDPGGA